DAGGVGSDHSRAALARGRQDIHGVVHRHVLGQADDLADPGTDGIERRLLYGERRNEQDRGIDRTPRHRPVRTRPARQPQLAAPRGPPGRTPPDVGGPKTAPAPATRRPPPARGARPPPPSGRPPEPPGPPRRGGAGASPPLAHQLKGLEPQAFPDHGNRLVLV